MIPMDIDFDEFAFPANEYNDTDPFIERIPEWMVLDEEGVAYDDGKEDDDCFWPHKNGCPICGSDAYVGFDRVECSLSSCQNFVERGGM